MARVRFLDGATIPAKVRFLDGATGGSGLCLCGRDFIVPVIPIC